MTEIQYTQRLEFLYQAARTIGTELSTDEVLQRLMALTHQHYRPDAVSVALVERDGDLLFRAASGESAKQIVGMRLPHGAGIVGWVAEHGLPLWSPDSYNDLRFYREADQQTGFHTRAILATPVKYGGQTLAVLEMLNPPADLDLVEAQEVLLALGSLAARAIQNARLFEQVQHAEARYQSLFEQNFDPIVILDGAGHLLEINWAAEELLALTPATHSSFDLSLIGLLPEDFAEAQVRVTRGETITWEFKAPVADRDRVLEVHLSYLPDYPSQGAYQWLAHDITDRVALEEMRQNLSNMVVHDLRAPLGSIINSLELMLTAWLDKEITIPVEQVLRIGLRSAQRMDRLINTILDIARFEANDKALTFSQIPIPQFVEEVLEIIQPTLKRRGHKLIVTLDPDLPEMVGDIEMLRRVLINIASNAVKYIQEKGVITLAVTANETDIQFMVRDNGPGIPLEDQAHLFEMFYRGKGRKQAQGAGLGLAFCKLAIDTHNGRIWVDSAAGQGATFYFTIPRHLSNHLTAE